MARDSHFFHTARTRRRSDFGRAESIDLVEEAHGARERAKDAQRLAAQTIRRAQEIVNLAQEARASRLPSKPENL